MTWPRRARSDTSRRGRCRACCPRDRRGPAASRLHGQRAGDRALLRRLRLIDPFGGRADLARRRLRVLHPLSYVEDPTRIFAPRGMPAGSASPPTRPRHARRRSPFASRRIRRSRATNRRRARADPERSARRSHPPPARALGSRPSARRGLPVHRGERAPSRRAARGARVGARTGARRRRGRARGARAGRVAPGGQLRALTRLGFAGGPLAVLERAHSTAGALAFAARRRRRAQRPRARAPRRDADRARLALADRRREIRGRSTGSPASIRAWHP